MKLLKVAFACTLALGISSTSLSADAVKGQKLFVKKFKETCGFAGDKFAAKHTQSEWETIMKNGSFKQEMIKICPNIKEEEITDSWIEHIYDFAHQYASDSGNVPSCN